LFKKIYRWFSASSLTKSLFVDHGKSSDEEMIRIHCHVDTTPVHDHAGPVRQIRSNAKPAKITNHAQKIRSMSVEELRLFSPKRCDRLRRLGISTAGQLVDSKASRIANHFGAKKKVYRSIRQYQRAILVASSIPKMLPKDAMLLFSVYRRHSSSLASDSPAHLLRDLQRYSQSTLGRKQLRGEPLPSVERIKTWIEHCATTEARTLQHQTAS